MTKELLSFMIEKTHELMEAPSCCAEVKAAAQSWLDSIGTEKEATQTKQYIADLESAIASIDDLLAFADSAACAQYLGVDAAKGLLAHAKELKASGAEYCDCAACSAVAAILTRKCELL